VFVPSETVSRITPDEVYTKFAVSGIGPMIVTEVRGDVVLENEHVPETFDQAYVYPPPPVVPPVITGFPPPANPSIVNAERSARAIQRGTPAFT
jgi:hypothetical protein